MFENVTVSQRNDHYDKIDGFTCPTTFEKKKNDIGYGVKLTKLKLTRCLLKYWQIPIGGWRNLTALFFQLSEKSTEKNLNSAPSM